MLYRECYQLEVKVKEVNCRTNNIKGLLTSFARSVRESI